MNNKSEKQSLPHPKPKWIEATAEDFRAVDLNKPLVGIASVNTHELSSAYFKYCKTLTDQQHESEIRVYTMLGAVCSFYFRPSNSEQPFEPMAQFGNRRTAAPGDFKGDPAKILAENIDRISNPAVRARVADTVWILDKKQAGAAMAAIDAYLEVIHAARNGSHSFLSDAGVHSAEAEKHLRRGVYIARAVGWEKEKSKSIYSLVSELRAEAARTQKSRSFQRLATLDLDFRISDPSVIAEEAEALAQAKNDPYSQHELFHVAARAHRLAKNQSACDRNLLAAAECLVKVADNHGGSALFESHWLECAIKEMQHIPNTKERRRELKHKLVDAQERIVDELTHFGHVEDISKLVEDARAAVHGKPLMDAICSFSKLSKAPSPAELEEEARRIISEHPLSSIFSVTQYDSTGKPVYRDKGIEDDNDQAVIQRQIAECESARRSLLVTGCIEPARLVIVEEHYVDEDAIGIICAHSPFVPGNRSLIYIQGLCSFFRGDTISALHMLVPQLENSLRRVLRLHGHDVTKFNEDLTQEELGLSVLLERLRPELNAIFGDWMVADIDNVFNNRAGPNLRNRLAHGLLSDVAAQSYDAIYACWLILQLCCIPLYPYWEQISKRYESLR